jgi:hypothetical protein
MWLAFGRIGGSLFAEERETSLRRGSIISVSDAFGFQLISPVNRPSSYDLEAVCPEQCRKTQATPVLRSGHAPQTIAPAA